MSRFFDRRLFREARADRAPLIIAVAAGLAGGMFTVFQARALSQAVNGAFLRELDLSGVSTALLILVGVTLLRAAATWLGEAASARAARRIKDDLRGRLIAHILDLGPAFTRNERTGELATAALDGVEALDAYFGQYLPQVALAAVVPLAFLAVIIPLDPLSAVVLLLTAPLIPVFMILIGNMADALTRRQWTALTRMAAHFLDMLQGLPTLKQFNASRAQIRSIREISDRHRDATLKVLRVAFLSALVLEMVGTIGTAIVAVEVGLRLLAGRLAFEQALFVLVLAPEFYLPLRMLGTRFHAGIAGVTAAQRIYGVLDVQPTLLEDRAPPTNSRSRDVAHDVNHDVAHEWRPPEIVMRGVKFGYEGREDVLNGVDLAIAAGEKVAVVGRSGAGKSSIAALLLRFYEPGAGDIVVDGRPLPEIPVDEWRNRVAWAPQMPYLFNASVRENIRLARPDAPEVEVAAAARAASADAFISELPQGYDTVLGERGARLSGGEAQRIALARAFLADAPFVVLDEATANLDPVTEAEVQEAIDRLLSGRTALIISHRGGAVAQADRVVRLEDGRVVEAGAGNRQNEPLAKRPPTNMRIGERIDESEAGRRERSVQSLAAEPPDSNLQDRTAPPTIPTHRVLSFLLSLLRRQWRWIALSVLLGFVTVGSSVGLLATSAWIISMGALQPSIAVLQVAIAGVRFFGIARGVFRYLERLASHQATFRVLADLRVWFYASIEPLAPARLAGRRSGDLLSRIMGDVGALENFYIRAMAPPLVAVFVGGLVALLLGAYDVRLVAAFLLAYVAAGVGLPLMTLLLGRAPGRQLSSARSELNAAVVDGVQGAADLAAYGAGGRYAMRVAEHGEGLGRVIERMARLAALGNAGATALAWLGAAAVLAVAAPLVYTGQLPGVVLAVLALATLAGFEAVNPLPAAAQHFETSITAGRRLLEVTAWHVQGGPEAALPLPAEGSWLPGAAGVSFERVTMRYAPEEPPALDEVSFEAPAGGLLTIVGASGAGKSTIVNVLLRFWGIESGAACVGGANICALAPEELRSSIGVVSQSTYLFNATIRDNLLLARPGAVQAELEEACRDAQIHDLIASLPEGYDTWIGENGLRLSGGERQRLALARALLKDAPLLILDEPTANLDAGTAAALWQALLPLMHGRTTLLITHRLGGIPRQGQILVLDRGRSVEQGTHEELLSAGGAYARLWAADNAPLFGPEAAA